MRKCFFLLGIINLFFSVQLSAQSTLQNSKRVNIGAGITKNFVYLGGNVEYAFADNLFVGVNLYARSKDSSFELLPSIRASYYLNQLLSLPGEKIDLYGGLGLTKNFFFFMGNNSSSRLYVPVHMGGRYFIRENIGFHIEVSPPNKVMPNSILNFGVSIKK